MVVDSVASIAALVASHYEDYYARMAAMQVALVRATSEHHSELLQSNIRHAMETASRKHESMLADAEAALARLSESNNQLSQAAMINKATLKRG